jgi:hypothetical protein
LHLKDHPRSINPGMDSRRWADWDDARAGFDPSAEARIMGVPASSSF